MISSHFIEKTIAEASNKIQNNFFSKTSDFKVIKTIGHEKPLTRIKYVSLEG